MQYILRKIPAGSTPVSYTPLDVYKRQVSGVSDTGEKINLQSQRKVDIVLAIDDASAVDAAKEASDNNLQLSLIHI